MKLLKKFIRKIYFSKEIIAVIILMIIGGFLRIYRLEELMTYLGDEGRDMLIVMDIIEGKNFPFIGPPTSVGKLYLGPIYYYFITPFAWLFKMSPVGPAFFVALTGIFSIFLIYLVGKIYFNTSTGLISALFFTISPLTVKFSRSSWNPNPMPFFTLLLLLFLFYWQRTKKKRFLYLSSGIYAIMLQLHYLVIIMVPFLIYFLVAKGKKLAKPETIIKAIIIFLIILSPVFLFDLKHNFVNAKGITEIYQIRSKRGFNFIDILSRSRDRLRQLFSLFFNFGERTIITNLLVISSIIFIVLFWLNKKKQKSLVIIYGWFLWAILALGLYQNSIYPHYLGFIFIYPALLTGSYLAYFFKIKNIYLNIIGFLIIISLTLSLLIKTWKELNQPSTLNSSKVKAISQLIVKESNNEPFNFSLLANNNYDDAYRYYFRLWNAPVSYKTTVTRQLFVVCEDLEVCLPEGNPKWEIALFDAAYKGKIKLSDKWSIDSVIKVFKFIPQDES